MGECKKVKKNQKILAILQKIVYTFQKQKNYAIQNSYSNRK